VSVGKKNIVVGLLFLAAFMLYSFVLIYLRDFSPGKEQWIANYAVGKHFESRLAHVHGNLFALINIAIGLVLHHYPVPEATGRQISWLGLAGLLMPIGIMSEVLFGLPPILVIVGGISMVICMAWLGIIVWRIEAPKGA
jgi:hypothetical protein